MVHLEVKTSIEREGCEDDFRTKRVPNVFADGPDLTDDGVICEKAWDYSREKWRSCWQCACFRLSAVLRRLCVILHVAVAAVSRVAGKSSWLSSRVPELLPKPRETRAALFAERSLKKERLQHKYVSLWCRNWGAANLRSYLLSR